MSLDHPRRKPWKSSSNIVTSSVACSLSRTCLPLFTDYDRLWPRVKSDEKKKKKWHRKPSRRRFAKIDQPNHRSASTFLLEYWCRLWIRLVAFWNPRWKRKCEKTLSQLHIVYFSKANVSTCKNRSLCVIAHMCTMKLITYGDGLSYRWLETYGGVLSYRGLHETGAMQKRYYISCVI